MADTASVADEDLPAMEDIPNMKVTDLKKKLRALGLPTMGVKTELVERLQEFCFPTKDSFESSHSSFDDSQIELENADGSAAEEDNALLESEHFSSYVDSSLDESKVLVSSENKLDLSSNSPAVAKPLKKRTITGPAMESSATEKKIIINRTNIAHSELNVKPDSKSEPVDVNNKSETGEKRVLSIKNMSAAERMALRAKRFNTNSAAATATNTTIGSKSTTVSLKNSSKSITSAPVATDLEILKKRAERFGQKVSTVLKQLEHKEKLLKRKCKFGVTVSGASTTTTSSDDQARKKQRAERFGKM